MAPMASPYLGGREGREAVAWGGGGLALVQVRGGGVRLEPNSSVGRTMTSLWFPRRPYSPVRGLWFRGWGFVRLLLVTAGV